MPFETLVMKVVGCRVIAAAGTVMCLIGVTTSAFASEIWQMVLSYGVVSSKLLLIPYQEENFHWNLNFAISLVCFVLFRSSVVCRA